MKNAALLWAILSISIISSAQNNSSHVGSWKLDVAQSDFGSQSAHKSWSLTILTDTPQNYTYRADGYDENGRSLVLSWSGPEDGSMRPVMVNGTPSDQTSGFTRQTDGAMLRHGERPDGSTVEVHITLSPDGNTLTDEFVSKSKDGTISKQKQVWHRAATGGTP